MQNECYVEKKVELQLSFLFQHINNNTLIALSDQGCKIVNVLKGNLRRWKPMVTIKGIKGRLT